MILVSDTATATSVASSDVQIIDSRPLGGAFVLDQLWDRLGIAAALREAAKGRRLDAEVVERVCDDDSGNSPLSITEIPHLRAAVGCC